MKSIAITKHTLKDHSGFREEHTIQFHPNEPSLILGINGAGKTSLLNSIYTSILNSLAAFVGLPHNNGVFSQSAICLLYTSPSPRDATLPRMPSSA